MLAAREARALSLRRPQLLPRPSAGKGLPVAARARAAMLIFFCTRPHIGPAGRPDPRAGLRGPQGTLKQRFSSNRGCSLVIWTAASSLERFRDCSTQGSRPDPSRGRFIPFLRRRPQEVLAFARRASAISSSYNSYQAVVRLPIQASAPHEPIYCSSGHGRARRCGAAATEG